MQAIEELKRLYREGKVSGNELHCVISSVLIHASLREPTMEYGKVAQQTAQRLNRLYRDQSPSKRFIKKYADATMMIAGI